MEVPPTEDRAGLRIRTDNTTVFFHLLNQGGKAEPISRTIESCLREATELNLVVSAEWIASETNFEADRLSRVEWDANDWSLHPRWFQEAWQRWGPFEIDLFATAQNTQLPRFFAPFPQPGAEAVDALKQSWSRPGILWANPPWALISRVLAKVQRENAQLAMVAPIWWSAPWFHRLLELSRDIIILPQSQDLFLAGMRGRQPMHNPSWRAAIFRLSGQVSRQQASRLRRHMLSSGVGPHPH
jgi:hypothetical protein